MTARQGSAIAREPSSDTAARKAEVRRAARARRRELAAAPDRDRAATHLLEAVLAFLPDARDPGSAPLRIAAYESLPDEPPTGALIDTLLGLGHEVIVPVVMHDFSLQWTYAAAHRRGTAATVTRLPEDATSPVGPGAWLGVDALASCDFVAAPGLTVDRHGVRLGQGAGCYDRALVHRDPGTPVVVLLHEGEQSETDLPFAEYDVRVDGYVTTNGRIVRAV